MAVQISESFQLYANAPLDSRTQFKTVAEMKEFPTSRLYEGIVTTVVANSTTYQYFSKNEVSEETGKWRVFGANTTAEPVQEHDRDAVHLVMNIANADVQPGDNYLYIGTEPFTDSSENKVVTGDIFTVNNDGTFTVLFHVGSGSTVVPDPEPIVVANPVITVSNGIVTITCDTENAKIYYTLNGSNPDSTSELYEEPITLTSDTVIKAVAEKNGTVSSVVTKTYTVPVPDSVEEPKIVIDQDGQVTIVCPTADATIYYTTDGSDPTDSSNVYSEAFTVTDGTTVRAIAVKGTAQSLVVFETYIVEKSYAYYGILSGSLDSTERITDEGVEVNEATISALNKIETTSAAGKVSFVASEADYNAPGQSFVVYAYPAKFGELTIYDFGLGTNPISNTFTKFDVEINGELYYAYAQTRGFAPTRVGATYNYTFN